MSSVLHIDPQRELVYFSSAKRRSTERHIYSVSYASNKTVALVDDKTPAFWDASFSLKGEYYILTYSGPDVPYQEAYSTKNNSRRVRELLNNAEFCGKINEYNLPNITYFELQHPDGFSLNVMQHCHPNSTRQRSTQCYSPLTADPTRSR